MDHEIGHSEYSGQSDRRMPISPSSSGVFFTGADASDCMFPESSLDLIQGPRFWLASWFILHLAIAFEVALNMQ